MSADLSGARVLVTGATGGIGHAIARALKIRGADLLLTGRKLEVLEPLAAELGAQLIGADLATPDGVQAVLEAAGDVDVLVANAALPGTGDFTEMSPELLDKFINVNLRAPIQMTHSVLPAMLSRGSGQIVIVGSLSGVVSSPMSAMYNATKFGVRGFASSLRQDLHGTGVGISLVAPGFVRDAGMFVNSGMQLPKGTRTVSPEQVAKAVVKAIEKDKGEIMVAPAELKLGGRLGGIAPSLNAAAQRASGASDIIAGHSGGE